MGLPIDDIRREIAKRRLAMRPPESYEGRLVLPGNPMQLAALDSAARQLAIRCTRRAGKSSGLLRKMAEDGRDHPGHRQVYVNTTKPECRRIAWMSSTGDGLVQLNRKYKLHARPNSTRMEIVFPNEHVIEIVSADDERAIEKLLGGAYFRVVLDEAQKMRFLTRFIREVLGPAMMDHGGQLVMAGTPSRFLDGFFYEVTRDDSEITSWEVHKWSVLDNPYFGATPEERYAKTIAKHLEQTGLPLDDPSIQREWFNQWVRTDAHFVYSVNAVPKDSLTYAPARYLPSFIPPELDGFDNWEVPDASDALRFPDIAKALADLPSGYQYNHVLGMDLGYEPDPFAFVIWSWSWDMPKIFELCSWKMPKLIPDRQHAIIEYIDSVLPIAGMVADAAGQKGVVKGWAEGWQERFGLPVKEAEKAHKAEFQEFLNGDIRAGKVQFREGSPLLAEMGKMTLRELPSGKLVEDERREDGGKRKSPKDLADAALYGYREVRHYLYEEDEGEPPLPGTPEWEEELGRKAREEMIEIARRQQEEWSY